MSATKEFTVRLPEASYDRACDFAADRHVELNQLIEEGLQLIDPPTIDQELFDDFLKLGEAEAQAEVVNNS